MKFILTHNYNCYNSYVLRISLHQTHILLNNGTGDLTIPFTNELQESWILLLKLYTNFRNNSSKDGMFKLTNISEALLYSGRFNILLWPLL